ncbi:MAG: hypothetical protein K6G11_04150 [Lachnospiraceae bacterium]|nr:hypothetical protein [Lachnospiraceae bacterium]
MNYKNQQKFLVQNLIKGLIIGIIVAIVLTALVVYSDAKSPDGFQKSDVAGAIICFLVTTFIVCAIVSVVYYGKSNEKGAMVNQKIYDLTHGLIASSFGGFTGSPVLIIIGVFKILVSMIVLIPLFIYLGFSFFVNLIYLTIMAVLEGKGKLEGKEDLCKKLDIMSNVISILLTAGVFIGFYWLSNHN